MNAPAKSNRTRATSRSKSTSSAKSTTARKPVARSQSASKAGTKPGATKATTSAGQRNWRDETLDRMRKMILDADPAMVEERKWRKPSNGMTGVPVWSHDGIVCTGETYKATVKLTFAKGASVDDPAGLFNASLEGGTRRAIDIREGETVDARAFKALVKAAVAVNASATRKR